MQVAPGTVVGTYGIERAYSTAAGGQNLAVVYGNRVAYVDNSAGSADIKLFDRGGLVNSAITIAGGAGAQFEPRIYGNRVAWTDNSTGGGDVYWYDIAKKTKRRLTTSSDLEGYVDLNNDYLVYERYFGSQADIMLYNFKTGETTRYHQRQLRPVVAEDLRQQDRLAGQPLGQLGDRLVRHQDQDDRPCHQQRGR